MRLNRAVRGCLLAVPLLCAPVVGRAADLAIGKSEDDLLNLYNQVIFSINGTIYGWLDRLSTPAPAVTAPRSGPAEPRSGPAQMVSNLVNEPLTMLSSVAVGDVTTAWNAAQRFGINSTYGLLGWYDEASQLGYQPVAADIGLSLCRMGVGEGGYVVLPFIGPRTWRDAAVDVFLVNMLLWTATGAILSTGVSVQTIIVAEAVEVVADVVATRQIDPNAKAIKFDNFDKMRTDYLMQRRERCAAPSAMRTAATGS